MEVIHVGVPWWGGCGSALNPHVGTGAEGFDPCPNCGAPFEVRAGITYTGGHVNVARVLIDG